ncbi:MAG: toprim domain-containing protein [Lachnospiraceae bacterium]|nr:toprim domain-containing protein [Lachnospiraceae bacterium]
MFTKNQIDELKSCLTDYVSRITEPSKGTNMYVCPLCGSGTGVHGTGAFSIKDGIKWTCFSCGESGDIFDLIGKHENISDVGQQMRRAAEIYGVQSDENYIPKAITKSKKVQPVANNENAEESVDYTEMFAAAHKRVNEKEPVDYLKKRGISAELIERFNIGYDPRWRTPKINASSNVPTSPRLIIPTSKGSYLARDIRPDNEQNKAFSKQKVGTVHFLNAEALYVPDKQPVYLVEGEINALSIMTVGGNAVALGSTSMVKRFLNLMKEKPPTRPLIIAFDNDDGGDKATKELARELTDLYISYIVYRPQGKKFNDANDALVNDREAFTSAVLLGNDFDKLKTEVREMNTETNNYEEHLQLSNGRHLQAFVDSVADSANDVCISTGFSALDEYIDGGLEPGLYIIGAVPSLGKTTFVLQVADNAALNGTDVLFFSLEMSRYELISKSISRHTAMYLEKNGGKLYGAKNTREISKGKHRKYFTDADKEMVEIATNQYAEYADRVFVKEGVGNLSAEDVRKTVETHIAATGKTPLVVIDYLQILAPCPGYEKSAERVIADKTTMELKRISRDFRCPTLVISSFNRQSYDAEVRFSSFKESGGLEYGADFLFGFQFEGAGKPNFSDIAAKSGNEYKIELVILKQRNGKTGKKIKYVFYPNCNYFVEGKGQKAND